MLDRDGDGLVSAAEFKELMGTIGVTFTDETAAKAIEMMDVDGDGLVSLEELARYMSLPHVNPDADGPTSPDAAPADDAQSP